ncbi:SDR family NAD(P)-dependent oxidoreductase [Radiobacillus deserti]|uniref:SDR family oxidoreductase n=1 Tax=Radiobacillus deserti TaxID=2594883 RepID=A0A516KE55_9BACI|nr:SDR family oxidoreductase [Radiobacillus deserti]QDP39670.1 SDR family oxidoreductase [Radiobacillus deserti]
MVNQIVIVTGAGNGIGKSIAIAYAAEGAKVAVVDKDRTAGEKTVQTIYQQGGDARFFQIDVRSPQEIINCVEEVQTLFGHINILINNAGVSAFHNVYDLTVAEWDDVINTNLRGAFVFSREVAKVMRHNKIGGSIINIASTRAFMSEPNSEAYAASKGGISALTHALALSLSEDGIRVNAISPGWIETGDYDALRSVDHRQHPANRVGKPDDVARACIFLTDPRNDFITGENIIIDGGMTRKMIYEH